jgi:hypothetical protein
MGGGWLGEPIVRGTGIDKDYSIRNHMRLHSLPTALGVIGATSLAVSIAGPVQPTGAELAPGSGLNLAPPYDGAHVKGREFYFTRAIYSSYGRRSSSWQIDFPKADVQFLVGVRRYTNIDAYEYEHPVRLDDPELRRYPFLYALEVGRMALTPPEIEGLRSYLLAGGFLVIDDFWDIAEWQNFEYEISQVLPEYPIVDIPLDHPLLSAFYEIGELVQVPNVDRAFRGGPTWECYSPCQPALRGIFDDHDRLMVVINWNTDLGDAWEWVEQPFYPFTYSSFAYKLGINMIIYGMSH